MRNLQDSLWREYEGYVHSVARGIAWRYGHVVDVDDLRQAAFVALLEAARRFDPARINTFDHYVRLRIRGAIYDTAARAGGARDSRQYRKGMCGTGNDATPARLRCVPLDVLEQGPTGADGVAVAVGTASRDARHVEAEIFRRRCLRALPGHVDALPPNQRAAVRACDLDGLTLAKAGERLGVSPATVLRWRRRGHVQLRQRLLPARPQTGAGGRPHNRVSASSG